MKKYFLLALSVVFLSGCVYQSQPQALKTGDSDQPIKILPSDSKLDLSNRGLTKIPGDIFNLTNLQELDVSNNLLTGAIQAEIRNLQSLKVLNASNNQMTGVPAEIGQLKNLEVLDLSNNKLTGLPYELGNLKNLKTLNISGNAYSEADLTKIMEGLPAGVNIIK